MNSASRRPIAEEEGPAPVTILDGLGRVMQVIPAEEFRRIHGLPTPPTPDSWRRRKERVKTGAIEQGAAEDVASR